MHGNEVPVLLHARCFETRPDNVNPFSRAWAYVMFLQKNAVMAMLSNSEEYSFFAEIVLDLSKSHFPIHFLHLIASCHDVQFFLK